MDAHILYEKWLTYLVEHLKILPDKPEENPKNTLRALWYAAAEMPRAATTVPAGELPALNKSAQDRLAKLVHRRIAGVPLAHLTGRAEYMGLEFLVGPQALVPRKETELLGVAALELVRDLAGKRSAETTAVSRDCATAAVSVAADEVVVMDLCTGAGNVAVALAKYEPAAWVVASDLSEAAVELARRNVHHHGVEERVEVHQGDLFEPLRERRFLHCVDVLTCNPPYIASKKVSAMPTEISEYEPRLAFDGGTYGVSLLHRLFRQAPEFLRPGGWLVFEIGCGQGPGAVRRLSSNPCFDELRTVNGAQGEIRVILARRSAHRPGHSHTRKEKPH